MRSRPRSAHGLRRGRSSADGRQLLRSHPPFLRHHAETVRRRNHLLRSADRCGYRQTVPPEHQGRVLRKPRLAHLRGPGRSGDCRRGACARRVRADGQHLGHADLFSGAGARRRSVDPGGDEIYRRPCRCDDRLCQRQRSPRHAVVQYGGNMGLYASGDDCFLALRGVRTLPVRLKRHQETALVLARWLAARPEVSRVLVSGAGKRSRSSHFGNATFSAPAGCSAWC